MSLLRIAFFAVWIGSNVLEGLLVALMTWRKTFRELPVFFVYACFDVVTSAVLAVILRVSFKAYFVAFWVNQVVCLLLGIAVVREVMLRIFQPYEALRELSALIFRWLAVVLVMLAIISAAAAPGTDTDRVLAGLFVMDRSVRLVQVGLLLFILLFSSYFRLSWRDYAFGIALGFGVSASVELAAIAVRATIGPISGNTMNIVIGAGQTCAVLIWCAYLLRPERHEKIEVLPRANLQQWNEALFELLHR